MESLSAVLTNSFCFVSFRSTFQDTTWAEEVLPPETMEELNELVSGERTEKVTIDVSQLALRSVSERLSEMSF